MGFFDEDATAAAPSSDTDLSGPVPHGEEASEFFAENNVEEPVAEETPSEPVDPAAQDVFSDEVPDPSPVATAPEEPPSSHVPIADLLLERKRRQDMEGELQEQRQTLAVLNERMQNAQRMQQMQQVQEQRQRQLRENPPPDPEEDPIGAANHKIQVLEQQLRNVAQRTAQQQQYHQQQQADQQQEAMLGDIVQQSQNLQNDFARTNPEYWDAFQHLIDTRTSELSTMGYEGANLAQIIDNEKGMIVNSCIDRDANGNMSGWKQNPAEVAFNLARQRGWQTTAERQPQQPVEPQVETREPVEVSAKDRMDMMNRGVQSSRSAGNIGSTANQGVLSLDQLADMTDTQFEQFQRENPGVIDAMLGS